MDRDQIYTSYMYSYPHKTAYGTIEIDRPGLMEQLRNEAVNLYLHIPFCETKCGYCNLFSVTGKQEADMEQYLDAVRIQAEQYGLFQSTVRWDSLTIGGGTPMLLSERQLGKLFKLADAAGALDAYSCIETAPNQTTAEKVKILKANRINRVSIGVQSFLDSELQLLQRNHKTEAAQKALAILKDADFDCLNVDLIYGIQSQTRDSLRYSLQQALAYAPDELFIYPLYIRRGTGLYARSQVQNDDTYDFYWYIRDYLLEQGYVQMSMRRFVRTKTEPGPGCGFESTLSLGCGGRSYIGNVHCCTPYAVKREECLHYLQEFMDSSDKCRMDFGYALNADEQKRRYVIKNLLHVDGICRKEYQKLFGTEIMADFDIFETLIQERYCMVDHDRIRLTPVGMSLSDYIGPMFISDAVRTNMEQWWSA